MKTKLIECVCAFGLLLGSSCVALADPHEAISKNIDKNGAFSPCDSSQTDAITNGNVVVGGQNAINNLHGAASNNSRPDTSAVDDPQSANVCGLNESQRVEPRSWWYSLARIIDRATAISKKRTE